MVVEAGARLTLLEELAPGEPGYLNGALELVLGDGAEVDLVQTQELHHDTYHFSAARAEIARDATLRWFALGLGGKLGKARQESRLGGPGSTVRATGLYALGERQHLDLDTTQEHAAPNAVSDLAFKGALRGHARSVWRGIIRVDKGAQKTDAYQENRNLLLSGHAHADSIPGLEIHANDVRCTHAATVGRVDSELLFFLMARGFERARGRADARHGVLRRRARADREPGRARALRRAPWRCARPESARNPRLRKLGRCGSSSLGGTRFVGRHIVEAVRAAGHTVTVFNRGQIGLPWDDVEHLTGDRETGDLESLRGRDWDVCLDVSAYLPQYVARLGRAARRSRRALRLHLDRVGLRRRPGRRPIDEESKLSRLPGDDPARSSPSCTARSRSPASRRRSAPSRAGR